jgi:hypothetical protein
MLMEVWWRIRKFMSKVVKLYKNINNFFHYFEAWNNGRNVTVHWGEVGRIGDKKIIKVKKGETSKAIIEIELNQARQNGFSEVRIDNHKMLVIRYELQTWGNTNDLKKRHEVENELNDFLEWTGNGHCDGGEIGSGSMEVFCYVIDPFIACKTMIMNLLGKGIFDGATISYKDNVTNEWEHLYPTES